MSESGLTQTGPMSTKVPASTTGPPYLTRYRNSGKDWATLVPSSGPHRAPARAAGSGEARGVPGLSSRPRGPSRSQLWNVTARSIKLPAVVGVGRDQPAPDRPGHHVQVVEVVPGSRGDGVIAARHQDDVAVADLDRLVQRAVVGVDELHGEPLGPRRAVVVGLLKVGLARRVVGVVLVRRVAGPVAGRGQDLGHEQRLGRTVFHEDVVDRALRPPS